MEKIAIKYPSFYVNSSYCFFQKEDGNLSCLDFISNRETWNTYFENDITLIQGYERYLVVNDTQVNYLLDSASGELIQRVELLDTNISGWDEVINNNKILLSRDIINTGVIVTNHFFIYDIATSKFRQINENLKEVKLINNLILGVNHSAFFIYNNENVTLGKVLKLKSHNNDTYRFIVLENNFAIISNQKYTCCIDLIKKEILWNNEFFRTSVFSFKKVASFELSLKLDKDTNTLWSFNKNIYIEINPLNGRITRYKNCTFLIKEKDSFCIGFNALKVGSTVIYRVLSSASFAIFNIETLEYETCNLSLDGSFILVDKISSNYLFTIFQENKRSWLTILSIEEDILRF